MTQPSTRKFSEKSFISKGIIRLCYYMKWLYGFKQYFGIYFLTRTYYFQRIKSLSSSISTEIIFTPFKFNSLIISKLKEIQQDIKLKTVVFDSKSKESLEAEGFEVFQFKEAWTDIDVDIKLHAEVKYELSKLPDDFLLANVECYEYLLAIKRFIYFFNKTDEKEKVVFILPLLSAPAGFLSTLKILRKKRGIKLNLLLFNKLYLLRSKEIKGGFINILVRAVLKCFTKVSCAIRKVNKIVLKNILKIVLTKNEIYEPISNSKTIAIICSTDFFSKYWNVFENLVTELMMRNVRFLCIVDDLFVYVYLRNKGVNASYLKRSIDESAQIDSTRFEQFDHLMPNLSSILSTKHSLLSRIISIFEANQIEKAFLLPHWSNIGSVCLSPLFKSSLKRPCQLYSAPIVSIEGNLASLIGWEPLDKIYCYGYQCVDAFKKIGIPKEKLLLSGNLLISCYRNAKINPKPIILIATSRIDKNENLWIQEVANYAKKQGYQCIIKVHPSFRLEEYQSLLKNNRSSLKIVTYVPDFYHLISESVICITDCSTVGVEAILLDRLLLSVNLTGKPFGANQYAKLGVALEARTLYDVCSLLDNILHDSKTQQRLRRNYAKYNDLYNFRGEGKAIAALVDNLISEEVGEVCGEYS